MKILLDLDGVLADFVGGIAQAHGRSNPYWLSSNHGKYDMDTLFGMKPEEFWRPTNRASFWADLQKMPDADEIMALCKTFVGEPRIAILTSPAAHVECPTGKTMWVQEHYWHFRRRLIITPAKHFLAHNEAVLIDDSDKNVIDFEKHGGRAILLPRPWNSQHAVARTGDVVDYLRRQLNETLSSIMEI